jgi:hypothetical protein
LVKQKFVLYSVFYPVAVMVVSKLKPLMACAFAAMVRVRVIFWVAFVAIACPV